MRVLTAVLIALLASTLVIAPCSARLVATTNTEYTRIQFAAHVAATKSISLSAAENLVEKIEQAAGESAHFTYGQFVSRYDYGRGMHVEAGVFYVMYRDPSQSLGVAVAATWTSAPRGASYTWTEAYHVVHVTPTGILQMVRGRVQTQASKSLASVIPAMQLQRAGFSTSTYPGNIWYFAKMDSWENTIPIETLASK